MRGNQSSLEVGKAVSLEAEREARCPSLPLGTPLREKLWAGIADLCVQGDLHVHPCPLHEGGSLSSKENPTTFPVTRGPRLWGDQPVLPMGLMMEI